MTFSDWKIISNYPAVDAEGKSCGNGFEASLNSGRYSLTRAQCRAEGFEGKSIYIFSYDVQTDPDVKYQLIYSWLDREDKALFRGHAVAGERIISPENACKIEMDLCFYGFHGGKGSISDLDIRCVGKYKENKVKLAALMIMGKEKPSLEYNLKLAAERIDAAAAEGADLILLPETYNTRGVQGIRSCEGAASMNDPAVTMLRDKAIEHHMFTAASIRLKDENGLISNSVLIFDREGGLVGKYTKCHLTMGEIWGGFIPGQEISTFDTELGRIGCSICWDRFMPEHARVLFMKGTDIILNPTASGGFGITTGHNGYANSGIIVTAQTTADPNLTCITGRNGETLAVADPEKGFAIAEVDVNAYDPIYWLSAPDAYTDPKSVYRGERRPDLYDILLEK